MNLTSCIVGNSSSAIREGAYIGTPAVNIGSRQNGRERAKNVIDTNNDTKNILKAIKKQILLKSLSLVIFMEMVILQKKYQRY